MIEKYPRYFLVDTDKVTWARERPLFRITSKIGIIYRVMQDNELSYWDEGAVENWINHKFWREIEEKEAVFHI